MLRSLFLKSMLLNLTNVRRRGLKRKGKGQAPKDVESTSLAKKFEKLLNKANIECYKSHKQEHYDIECIELEICIPKHNHTINVISSVMITDTSLMWIVHSATIDHIARKRSMFEDFEVLLVGKRRVHMDNQAIA